MNLQLVQKTLQTHLLHMKNLLKLGLAKKVIISVIFLTYLTPLSDPAELFGTPPSHLFGSEDYGTGCSL